MVRRGASAALLLLGLTAPAAVAAPGCVSPGPLPAARAPVPLRFGITGQAAGSAGAGQSTVAPEDPARAFAALDRLRRPGRDLVLRLNRMFQSDGAEGIARFGALADAYAARGYRVELQVRYHPPAEQNGDVAAYVAFVRAAVRAFAPRPAVVALSITNEANLVASPNTSDGFYARNVDALVEGLVAARAEADRLGRPDLALGFTYAYRFVADESFFDEIGKRMTPQLARALDYVGLQAYPGLVYPPGEGVDAAKAMVDAANLLRTCFFPRAGIGPRTAIWVTENGYRARRSDDAAVQAAKLRSTVEALSRVSGTLGITDYRYFNLRDNDSEGSDLFDAVGLLYDDYVPKPAYGVFEQLIDRFGAPALAPSSPLRSSRCPSRRLVVHPLLRRGERIRSVAVRARGGRAGAVRVTAGRRAVAIRLTGAGRTRVSLRLRTTRGRLVVARRTRTVCRR